MVVVLSRFRVANAMEAEVARAFRERPRAVEQAPGFLWLEVFADAADAAVFYLLTRWTDADSFERWHGSAAHRESHAFIPKGLKLDPAWTRVSTLARLDGTTGPPITEVVADATLLFGTYAATSTALHLFVVGADATVRACNAAACRDLEPEGTLEGKPLTDYMPDADAARLRALLAAPGRKEAPTLLNFAAPNGGQPFTLECWLEVRADGATLLGQPVVRREQQLQNELMAINEELAVLSRQRSRDAREERRGRELAERVNHERNAFLAVLAHELRQPLGSALTAVGVSRLINPDPKLERARAVIERQLTQISRLVEDLADTARIAGGDVTLRRTQVDVAGQLRDLATTWVVVAQQQRSTLSCALPDDPLVVWGDQDRLQQVFSNLVGNAFRYTPPGGDIRVTARRDGASAVVVVQDDGEGIPADRLPRIFEMFHRATTTGAGLGVGLAVVHALVQAHDGEVTVVSEGRGHGTMFTVRLPLAPSGDQEDAAHRAGHGS